MIASGDVRCRMNSRRMNTMGIQWFAFDEFRMVLIKCIQGGHHLLEIVSM